MLWQKIVDYALLDIGVAIAGEDILERHKDIAFDYLKLMLGAWSTDALLVPSYKSYSHTIAEKKSCFTLGDDDSDIDLEGHRIISVSNVRYKSAGFRDYGPYLRPTSYSKMLQMQSGGEGTPSHYYWQNSYPESLLWFSSVPPTGDKFDVAFKTTLAGESIVLTDETGLPTEYEYAIRCCLAEELLLPFSGETNANMISLIMQKARESKRKIRHTECGRSGLYDTIVFARDRLVDVAYQQIQWAKQSTSGDQEFSSGERLVNLYAVRAAPKGGDSKVPVILYGSPGLKPYAQFALNPNKDFQGIWLIDSPIYGRRIQGVVDGDKFFDWRIDVAPSNVSESQSVFYRDNEKVLPRRIGGALIDFNEVDGKDAIAGYAIRHAVGRDHVIIITQNRAIWAYSMADGDFLAAIAAPTASDQSALLADEDWVDCVWLDGYFILATRGGELYHSLLNEVQFEQLDFALASNKPDEIVGLAAWRRRLFIFGSESIEFWYNAGDASFAFRRDPSFVHEIGCISKYTIESVSQGVFFLGSDKIVYLYNGQMGRISSESVEADIKQSQPDKARAFSYDEEGHRFYSLTLYKDDVPWKNWTFDNTTYLWHERTELRTLSAVMLSDNLGNIVCRASESATKKEQGLYVQTVEEGSDFVRSHTASINVPINREAVSPILHADQRRARMKSFQVDVQKPEGGLTINRICGDNLNLYFDGYSSSRSSRSSRSSVGEVWSATLSINFTEARNGAVASVSVNNLSDAITEILAVNRTGDNHDRIPDQRGHTMYWYPDLNNHPSFWIKYTLQSINTVLDVYQLILTRTGWSQNIARDTVLFYIGTDLRLYKTQQDATDQLDSGLFEVNTALVFEDDDVEGAREEFHRHCISCFVKDQGIEREVAVGHKSLENARFKWNQLGQFREGRNMKLGIRSSEKIRILGAYVEVDVGDG